MVGSAIFAAQQEAFADVADKLGEHVTVHAANSGATIHQAGVHFDMIRNGTALYGFDPNGESESVVKAGIDLAFKSFTNPAFTQRQRSQLFPYVAYAG